MDQDEHQDKANLPAVIAPDAIPTVWLPDEVAQARNYADASRAVSTRRAYEADWTRFTTWCGERGLAHLPADPRVIAMFLSGEAARGCAPPTVNRRLAAIGWAHRRVGLQPPQKTEGAAAITEVLAGIRRSRTTPPGKKSASDADVTWTLLHYIRGERLRDQRDRALIALGMAAALRRSELVALRVEDLQRVPQRLRLRISRPKTDQEGARQVVAFPGGKRLRPVALVEAWLRPTTAATACAAGS